MAHRNMVPPSVRASRLAPFFVPALVLASVAGCSHKRSAMRPVFTTPIPAASSPTVVVPSSPTGTVTTEPDPSEPFLIPNESTPAPATISPGRLPQGRNSPPVPNEAGEPPLTDPGPPGSNAAPSSSGAGGIELTKPSALKSTGRKANAPRRAPRVSSREEVRPFLNDADDLFQPPKADRPWKYVVLHHSANPKGVTTRSTATTGRSSASKAAAITS